MTQDVLSSSILSTLALAEAENCPALSHDAIAAYLHRTHGRSFSDTDIALACADLAHKRIIRAEHNHYALPSHTHAFRIAHERAAAVQKKIARNEIPLLLLEIIPFLQGAAITGSVAFDSATEHSDVDIFCIAEKRRLWTVRALALLCAALFLRRRDTSITGEKLCFNYFLADDAVAPIRNIAAANMFARSIPLFGSDAHARFFASNLWIGESLTFPKKMPLFPTIRILRAIARLVSFLLSGAVGDRIESLLKQWQIRRLERKSRQGGDTEHLILRDNAILLHYPESKNKEIMKRYEQRMHALGITRLS